jgi:hypothetical protein
MLGLGNGGRYDNRMKTIAHSIFIGLVCGAAAICSGAIPSVNVIVADSSGKTAYKGATDSRGIFASPKLTPGSYAVQFTSSNAPKGSHYTVVVVAGTKKTHASAITAEKLAGGGVAMKIDVGPGRNIQAQVAEEDKGTRVGKNGKLMVWIPKRIGSNLAPHWAESDSAEAKEVMASTSYSLKNMQNKQNQGISPVENQSLFKVDTSSMRNPSTGR